MHPRLYAAAAAIALVFFASSWVAEAGSACSSCASPPALVEPVQLLPYTDGPYFDYRPAINAAATKIVFERQALDPKTKKFGQINLVIADLATPHVTMLAPLVPGSARADWCWRPQPSSPDGLIVFSQGENGPVFVTRPVPGASSRLLPNSANSIYPTWYPNCEALALYRNNALEASSGGKQYSGPTTLKVHAVSGYSLKRVSGFSLWAGFPSVNPQQPSLLAFAGQQFDLNTTSPPCTPGYDQDCNYIYIADNAATPPRIFPLERNAPRNMYNGAFQGRAPTWSPDAKWIAFESNRTCTNKQLYQIYIVDSQGRNAPLPVTACTYDAQHAKWYSKPVHGRTRLIVSVLATPSTNPQEGVGSARKISYLDVTDFVTR